LRSFETHPNHSWIINSDSSHFQISRKPYSFYRFPHIFHRSETRRRGPECERLHGRRAEVTGSFLTDGIFWGSSKSISLFKVDIKRLIWKGSICFLLICSIALRTQSYLTTWFLLWQFPLYFYFDWSSSVRQQLLKAHLLWNKLNTQKASLHDPSTNIQKGQHQQNDQTVSEIFFLFK